MHASSGVVVSYKVKAPLYAVTLETAREVTIPVGSIVDSQLTARRSEVIANRMRRTGAPDLG
jgi:hypothetical protein